MPASSRCVSLGAFFPFLWAAVCVCRRRFFGLGRRTGGNCGGRGAVADGVQHSCFDGTARDLRPNSRRPSALFEPTAVSCNIVYGLACTHPVLRPTILLAVARRARWPAPRCARSARAADPLVRFRDDSFLISSQKTTRLSTGPVLRPLAWRACPRVNPYVSKLSHPLPQAPGRPPMYFHVHVYSPSSPSATKVCSTPRGGLARSMARSHRATIRIAISPSSDRDRSGLQFVHDPATPNETTPNETPLPVMWS